MRHRIAPAVPRNGILYPNDGSLCCLVLGGSSEEREV